MSRCEQAVKRGTRPIARDLKLKDGSFGFKE